MVDLHRRCPHFDPYGRLPAMQLSHLALVLTLNLSTSENLPTQVQAAIGQQLSAELGTFGLARRTGHLNDWKLLNA